MRILFGAADRDLLACYAALLASGGREVETAFDGAQMLTKLAEQAFGLVIVSDRIPRVPAQRIVRRCQQTETPVIVLLTEPPDARTPPADACLPLPFSPAELTELIGSVLSRPDGQKGDRP